MSTAVMPDLSEKAAPLRRQECFFWLCAAAAVLVFLGRNSLFGAESFAVEAAREAAEWGNWLTLGVNGAPFPRLPVLETWSIAAAFSGFGVSEFAARLPSALAVLVLLAGVRALAGSLFDRRTALLAGWLTLGSYGFLYLGRSVAGGVPGCAAVVWAVAWYCRGDGRPTFLRFFVFHLLVALGVWAGGGFYLLMPAVFLLPGTWRGRRGAEIFSPKSIAALLPAAAIAAAWPVFAFRSELLRLFDRAVALLSSSSGWAELGALLLRNITARRSDPVYAGSYEVLRVMLPWAAVLLSSLVGMFSRFRALSAETRSLLYGALLLFLFCAVPPSARWTDFLPLVPFLSVITAAGLLDCGREEWNVWAVAATRSVLVVLAALGAVSPVALPVWRQLFKTELPVVVLLTLPVMGAAVLLIMILDSYPTRPLGRLTGLPERLGSTVLGGTLITICLISLVVPALREMRYEKPFFLSLRPVFAELEPDSVIFAGSRSNSAVMLFYTGLKKPCTVVSDGDLAGFGEAVARRAGKHLAIVTRYREKRELEFLRRGAAAAGLKLDVKAPDHLEKSPQGYGANDRRRACWLVTAPAANEKGKTTILEHKDK